MSSHSYTYNDQRRTGAGEPVPDQAVVASVIIYRYRPPGSDSYLYLVLDREDQGARAPNGSYFAGMAGGLADCDDDAARARSLLGPLFKGIADPVFALLVAAFGAVRESGEELCDRSGPLLPGVTIDRLWLADEFLDLSPPQMNPKYYPVHHFTFVCDLTEAEYRHLLLRSMNMTPAYRRELRDCTDDETAGFRFVSGPLLLQQIQNQSVTFRYTGTNEAVMDRIIADHPQLRPGSPAEPQAAAAG